MRQNAVIEEATSYCEEYRWRTTMLQDIPLQVVVLTAALDLVLLSNRAKIS